jgi:DNA-binding NtrC family response regulator
MRSVTILVCDADLGTRQLLEEILSDKGYASQSLPLHSFNLDVIARLQPTVVILEALPQSFPTTIAWVEQIREAYAFLLPIVVTTTDPLLATHVAAELERLQCALLVKPFELDTLLQLIAAALKPDDGATGKVDARHLLF